MSVQRPAATATPPTGAGKRAGRSAIGRAAAVAAALVVAVLVAFSPLREAGFLNFDDDRNLTQNSRVSAGLSAAGVRWAFRSVTGGNWHPVTWISHQADWSLFGDDPRGHHLASVLVHAATTVLLFGVLLRTTGAFWRSALVAALFGLHPLHVESVAWIAERKDLLCGFFWVLTLGAYRRYAARPSPGRYGAVVASLALALMAKPMAVTLPLVLLLLDYWPLGRARRGAGFLLAEKAPLLLLAAALGVVTLLAQRAAGAATFGETLPAAVRLGNAVTSVAAYLGQTILPVRLAVFYPHPVALSPVAVAAGAILVGLLGAAAIRLRRELPALLAGWLWFLGTLLPVLGLVQVGLQARADRYTYLPLVGVFIAASWGTAAAVRQRPRAARVVACAAGPLLAALVLLTYRQAGFWRSSVELFEHALVVTEPNPIAHNNLGSALLVAGRAAEARAHFEAAIALAPGQLNSRANLGIVLLQEGRVAEAAGHFQELLRTNPGEYRLHTLLGNALMRLGRFEEAARSYRQALALAPENPEVRANLARVEALARSGGR
jgi:tetratricopeptide (TPR) repeat protein